MTFQKLAVICPLIVCVAACGGAPTESEATYTQAPGIHEQGDSLELGDGSIDNSCGESPLSGCMLWSASSLFYCWGSGQGAGDCSNSLCGGGLTPTFNCGGISYYCSSCSCTCN
jgi:hypothetical protein